MAGACGKCWAPKRQVGTYVYLEGSGNRGGNVEKIQGTRARKSENGPQNIEKTWKNTEYQEEGGGPKKKTDMRG